MSFTTEEASQLVSGQRRRRSNGRHHKMKHRSAETASVDDVSNQGISHQLHGGVELGNEDTQSSVCMQDILGLFLATKLQTIESENQRSPRSTISKKLREDRSRKSSRKTSRKRSSDFSDVRVSNEFKYDRNVKDCRSDSKSPNRLDFWNYSERSSSCAMLDRTRAKILHGDRLRSHQCRGNVHQQRDDEISVETDHRHFRSSALRNHNGSYGNGAFHFSDVSLEHAFSLDKEEHSYGVSGGESLHGFPLEISREYLSGVNEDNHVKSESHVHKSKRKRSFPNKSKEVSEHGHKKSRKKSRTRKESAEVSTFTNPNFQTASIDAKAASRCYQDSLYDDAKGIASESDENDFGFSSNRHSESRQKSFDYFGLGTRSRKPDNPTVNRCTRNADFQRNDGDDICNETWVQRYNKTKNFKRHRSQSGSLPAVTETDPLQYDKYSQLISTDPIWGHSGNHDRLAGEGEIYTNCGERSDALSHIRSKMHGRNKIPMSSLKKKSSRKDMHAHKHEKKRKHRDKSLAKSSHKHKSTKHKHRKNKNKVLAESIGEVEIAKSCVLPHDDVDASVDNFRPMLRRVENNDDDDITELWLGKRTKDVSEQCVRQQLDYNAVVACAEQSSVPSRIVKTYKEGIAVSRLLRRVKTRMGPMKSAEISRLQATLPRHPLVIVDKSSQQKSDSNDQVHNSTVVQDVEDPAVQKQEQTQTCGVLSPISNAATEHANDDILKPLGVLGELTVVKPGSYDYLDLPADPNPQDQLSGETGSSQETVSVKTPEQGVQAETSVDPLMTVELATATAEPCLRLSSEFGVTGSVETTESETYANDPVHKESYPEALAEALVSAGEQKISVESSDNLTSCVEFQLLENFCIVQHSSEQDKRAVADQVQETSVDPLMTVKTEALVSAGEQKISVESSDNLTSCVEFQLLENSCIVQHSSEQDKRVVADQVQETSVDPLMTFETEALASAGEQTISLESSDNLTLYTEIRLMEDSCIDQHFSEPGKRLVADEVQHNLSSNCDILQELVCNSCCSERDSQNVENEITTIILPDKEMSSEAVAIAIADPSASTFAEETVHVSADACQQDEVNGNRQSQEQCFTLIVSDIVEIGTEIAAIRDSQKEVPDEKRTAKEASENNASEVHEIEVIEKEITGKEECENEAMENEVGDVEYHCTEKEITPENEEFVSKASNSPGTFSIESEVERRKDVVCCNDLSSSAEQKERAQILKTDFLNKFVKAGCSVIPRDTEPFLEPFKVPAPMEDCKTVKKQARYMGIKISGWSAAFISSGTRYENDPKKRNREEGELTDSSASSSDSEDFEPAPLECVLDLVSSGSLSDSGKEEIEEEPTVTHKSKERKKKHKRKHKKRKKQKKRHSIESSSDEEQSRSRSRSRSFSVARTFDEKKGVWREKKHKPKSKKVPAKNRPRLNIDKEKLREIAINNSLHNQMRLKKPTTKSNEVTGTRQGGKSVAELTDFCKTISGRRDYNSSTSEDEEDARQRVADSLEDESETFLSNFMKSRDKDARIVLNIRDSRQLPALTAQEMIAKKAVMRLMYPVSSGAQHRKKEEGWVPVIRPDPDKPLTAPQDPNSDLPFPTVTIPAVPPTSAGAAAVELATARAPVQEIPLLPPNADVHTIITERLAAIRRLNADPSDAQAYGDVLRAQMQMQQWAEQKQVPGQFFTSVLRMGLMGNKLKKHDWLSRTKQNAEPYPDAAAAVLQGDSPGEIGANNSISTFNPLASTDGTYNIGKLMMLRMGWKESEGLGRQNLGRLTPLCLDQKKDRKGLQAPEERTRPLAQVHSVKGKHPVSALMEICVKRRIGQPEFVLVEETGPSHLRRFQYKVILNGIEYQPNIGSHNKKTAKVEAAVCCLDALGLSAVNN